MSWSKCLLDEAQKIVSYGQGKLEFFVSKRQDKYLSIQILAGKRFDFLIKKLDIED